MKKFFSSYLGIISVFIFLSITLFPPFSWNLSDSIHNKVNERYKYKYGSQLPLRNYEFLFNPTIKKYDLGGWTWDGKNEISLHEEIPLQRNLILYELLLNYVLATLLILLGYTIVEKLKTTRK